MYTKVYNTWRVQNKAAQILASSTRTSTQAAYNPIKKRLWLVMSDQAKQLHI